MITISPTLLQEMDINLSAPEQEKLLNHLEATLESRVGEEVVGLLDDAQLDEYVELQETADLETQHKWLLSALPDLDEIVEDEYNILVGELAENYQQFMK